MTFDPTNIPLVRIKSTPDNRLWTFVNEENKTGLKINTCSTQTMVDEVVRRFVQRFKRERT